MDDSRPPQPESDALPPTARAVSLEELYVSNPHPAEDNWFASLLTVALVVGGTLAFFDTIGYNW